MSQEIMNQNNSNEPTTKVHKALTIVGIVLCVILIPMLIINCTLIIKSFINKDEVPNIGGVLPLIVLTDSMAPEIMSGDIIICQQTDPESIVVGDDISFFDPAGNGTSIVTHRVIEIVEEDGQKYFRTKGINNNTEDRVLVPMDKLVGKYIDVRFPGAGHIALFMQSTPGLIVCVVVPIILLVGYDMIRRRMYEKSKGNDMETLMAELEALKAAKAEEATAPAAEPAPVSEPTPQPAPETPAVDIAALMAELEALKAAAAAQAQSAAPAPAEESAPVEEAASTEPESEAEQVPVEDAPTEETPAE
jgi:signal peptidase